jgi:hypothetical protein
MKSLFCFCLVVIVLLLRSRGEAQLTPVLTPGLTPPQCVRSNTTNTIVDNGTCVTTPANIAAVR